MGDFCRENFIDIDYETNHKQSEEKGIPNGVYYVSRATTAEGQRAEARKVLNLLEGKKYEYPIYLDIEPGSTIQKNIDAGGESLINTANNLRCALKLLEENGYYVGIYCDESRARTLKTTGIFEDYCLLLTCGKTYSKNYTTSNMEMDILQKYNYIPTISTNIRQLTDHGKSSAVSSAYCDIDIAYSSISDTIVNGGFNNY